MTFSNKRAYPLNSDLALRKNTEYRENVWHFFPDFKVERDIRSSGLKGGTKCIVQQDLGAPYNPQDGRQAVKVGEHRRGVTIVGQ